MKQYHCSFCGKVFYHKSNLKRHEMVHTGEKPFECELCDKKFNQKISLKKHMLYHASTFGGHSFKDKE